MDAIGQSLSVVPETHKMQLDFLFCLSNRAPRTDPRIDDTCQNKIYLRAMVPSWTPGSETCKNHPPDFKKSDPIVHDNHPLDTDREFGVTDNGSQDDPWPLQETFRFFLSMNQTHSSGAVLTLVKSMKTLHMSDGRQLIMKDDCRLELDTEHGHYFKREYLVGKVSNNPGDKVPFTDGFSNAKDIKTNALLPMLKTEDLGKKEGQKRNSSSNTVYNALGGFGYTFTKLAGGNKVEVRRNDGVVITCLETINSPFLNDSGETKMTTTNQINPEHMEKIKRKHSHFKRFHCYRLNKIREAKEAKDSDDSDYILYNRPAVQDCGLVTKQLVQYYSSAVTSVAAFPMVRAGITHFGFDPRNVREQGSNDCLCYDIAFMMYEGFRRKCLGDNLKSSILKGNELTRSVGDGMGGFPRGCAPVGRVGWTDK